MLKKWKAFVVMMALCCFMAPLSHSQEKTSEQVKQSDKLKSEGYYSQAADVLEKALALKKETSENTGPELAEIMDQLGELYYLAGKYSESEPVLLQALSIKSEIFGPDHLKTGKTYGHLGILYNLKRKNDQAEVYLGKAYQISKKAYGENHPVVASILVNMGRLLINFDKRDQAETILSHALAAQETFLGKDHPDLIYTLNTLAWLHMDTENFEKAEPFAIRALEIGEKTFGSKHPYVADSLNYLGRLHYSRRDHEKSIDINKRALTIREEFLGSDHPDVGLSLNNLALPYCGLEQYETAKDLFVRSLSIREKVFGANHPILLVMLNNTGWVYQKVGDYAGAATFYERMLAIRQNLYGPDHTDVADSLKDLAGVYHSLGDYSKAEQMLNRSLEIYKSTLGPTHPRVASNLTHLAFYYHSTGQFDQAEIFYKESIEICKIYFEHSPSNLANNLISLAALYNDKGEYKKAEPLYDQALEILETNLGPKHSSVGYVLNNMGRLYHNLEDFKKAESLYHQALVIWENTLGGQHPNVAITLDNLAMLYQFNKDYDKAKPLYKRALDIREKQLGPHHPDTAKTLNNLAALYTLLDDFAKAEPLFQKVLRIKAETIGTENISYANSLHNLALIYLKSEAYEEAEGLYNQAIDIWSNRLGPDHQNVSTGYGHLSQLFKDKGDVENAYHYVCRSLEIDNKLIDQVAGFTSERQKLQFLAGNQWSLHYYLHLVNQHFNTDNLKIRAAFDVWLKTKGRILDVQKSFQKGDIAAENPETVILFEELNDVRARLSKVVFAIFEATDEKNYKQIKSELEKRKERLEAQLSRVSRSFELNQKVAGADSRQIAKVLSSQTALVEFARVEFSGSEYKDAEKKVPDQYICFVLHSGEEKEVAMINLGDAEKIDHLIARYKKELSQSGDGAAAMQTSRKLYDLVFKPLQNKLGEIKNIFISPDGNLNLIPFEVLQKPDGKFLIQEYTFNYLAAGRDLLAFNNYTEPGQKYVLMGDPDFDLAPSEKHSLINDIKFDEKNLMVSRSSNINELSFEPLYHAKAELKAIGDIMGPAKCDIFTGPNALEEILFARQSPEILHLATHGFFLGDQTLPSSGRGWEIATFPAVKETYSEPIDRVIDIENPLLRSGILLAGAKNSLIKGSSGTHDGIVTAEKILGMNLHGTKMVVLSACDTGLGEVRSGEGVFGLRRAFTQAGAKSLVMSMWKVPDRETKELMVQFYKNIKSGMDRCQALRDAALKQIRIVEKRYGHTNPLYWGAFVFMGEP